VENVVGIDFRPANAGSFTAFGSASRLYTIDIATAA